MYQFCDIKTVQIEISSYCNAACPQCPRNYFGGKTIPTLPLRKWNFHDFKKIFTKDFIEQLTQVYFCGTYGDPMTNHHILEMCQYLRKNNSKIVIGIHTNGGVGKPNMYKNLAKIVNFIAFSIDGLQDTNHVYRRQVSWEKLLNNCTAYIQAGGYAVWDFIVFEHNQHQVEIARSTSKKLGFSSFNIKKTSRFLNRNHRFSTSLDVYSNTGKVEYVIQIPTDTRYVNEGYRALNFVENSTGITQYAKNTCINCNASRIKEIYIGAEGFVFPCGWLHDRLYGPEIEVSPDHHTIQHLMQQAGGWQLANVFHTSLESIVNGNWFKVISTSWNSLNRLERCGVMCGDKINLIGPQNSDILYKE